MKAAYYAGDRKVEVGECKVQSPGPGEVRIDVAYCGVCLVAIADRMPFIGPLKVRLFGV